MLVKPSSWCYTSTFIFTAQLMRGISSSYLRPNQNTWSTAEKEIKLLWSDDGAETQFCDRVIAKTFFFFFFFGPCFFLIATFLKRQPSLVSVGNFCHQPEQRGRYSEAYRRVLISVGVSELVGWPAWLPEQLSDVEADNWKWTTDRTPRFTADGLNDFISSNIMELLLVSTLPALKECSVILVQL